MDGGIVKDASHQRMAEKRARIGQHFRPQRQGLGTGVCQRRGVAVQGAVHDVALHQRRIAMQGRGQLLAFAGPRPHPPARIVKLALGQHVGVHRIGPGVAAAIVQQPLDGGGHDPGGEEPLASAVAVQHPHQAQHQGHFAAQVEGAHPLAAVVHTFVPKHPLQQDAVLRVAQHHVQRAVRALVGLVGCASPQAAPALNNLGVQFHQLLRAVRVRVVAQVHERVRTLRGARKLHPEQGIEGRTDLRTKTACGVDAQDFRARRQAAPHVLQRASKHRERALVDVLVEVARAHKHAVVALHQLAQNRQRAFVQVVQFIKQHRAIAPHQRLAGLVPAQQVELAAQLEAAVALGIEAGFVVHAHAHALVVPQQAVQAVVQVLRFTKIPQGAALVLALLVQLPLLGQGFKRQKRVDVHVVRQHGVGIQVRAACQLLAQRLLGLKDQEAPLHRVIELDHRIALGLEHLFAELLDRQDLQAGGHRAMELEKPVAQRRHPGAGIGQHQDAPLRPQAREQLAGLHTQRGGFARARQRTDDEGRCAGLQHLLLFAGGHEPLAVPAPGGGMCHFLEAMWQTGALLSPAVAHSAWRLR